jgi:hypothetical protein
MMMTLFSLCYYTTGNPPPEVSWYKNGRKVFPTSNVKAYSEEDGSHVLLINDALDYQSGDYSCKAKNAVGDVEAQFTITIEGLLYN